jgi:predicted RNA-binding protein with RPS1 domain
MIPIVKDENGNIVHINDINENNSKNIFKCLACGADVKPRSLSIDNKMQPHFYHLNASECKNESIYHKMYKEYLFKTGKDFVLNIDGNKNQYTVKEIYIEKSYETKFGIYKPDVTVITDCGKTIYFEMDYTSKKYEEEYFDKWSELNNDVVEVDIKKLYRLSYTTDIPEFDVIYHDGVCTCKYEKQSRSSTYYKTIGNYKRENKFTPEKIQQIEKLDWFWVELQRYKKGITDEERVVELFSYLDIDERDICVEIVKKLKCIDLIQRFKTFVFDNFKKHIKTTFEKYTYNDEGSLIYYFDIVQVTPQKYRIIILPIKGFELFDKNEGYEYYNHYCKFNCGSCRNNRIEGYQYQCETISSIIRSTSGIFNKHDYDYIIGLATDNDFINYIEYSIQYIDEKVNNINDIQNIIENNHINTLLSSQQIVEMMVYDHNDYISIYCFITKHIDYFNIINDCKKNQQFIYKLSSILKVDNNYSNLKTILSSDINSLTKNLFDFEKLKIVNSFLDRVDDIKDIKVIFNIFDKYRENDFIERFYRYGKSFVYSEIDSILYDLKENRRKKERKTKLKNIMNVLNNSNFIKYEVTYNNNISYRHIDLDKIDNIVCISTYELDNLSNDEILNKIYRRVNCEYKNIINNLYPQGWEIEHMIHNQQEEV